MVMIALGEPLPEPFQRVHVETLSQKNRKLRPGGRAHVAAAAAESVRSIEAPAAMPARKRRGLIEIEPR